MSDKTDPQRMEKIVSLCKRRGFIFQSSEIYGGLNGCWDYGPLGVELKRNVKDYWWRVMVRERDDIVGMDGSILTHRAVLKASGHEDTFSDPMVDCLLTKKRLRADQIEPRSGTAYHFSGAVDIQRLLQKFDAVTHGRAPNVRSNIEPQKNSVLSLMAGWKASADPNDRQIESALRAELQSDKNVVCDSEYSVLLPPGKPREGAQKIARQFYAERGIENAELQDEHSEAIENTTRYNPESGSLLTEPRAFNLMFRTNMGASEDESSVAYLRPETAQSIFVQFKNVLDTSRKKLPFGIAQIGKAFRNEINPRNFTFRSREFEQMELEYFCRPEQGMELLEYWKEERLKFYENIGIPREKLHVLTVLDADRAFYSKGTYDIEYEFPFGVQELEGVAYRTDYDLKQHQEASGKSLDYFDEETKQRFIPHVVEPSAGVDRTVLALLCNAYDEETVTDEKGKSETRIVMRFHPRVAPIKVGVFPLLKNNEQLVAKAREIQASLRPHMNVFYDETGAIGRRYRRQDEAGTPFCITVDFETLGRSEKPTAAANGKGLADIVIEDSKESLSDVEVPTPKGPLSEINTRDDRRDTVTLRHRDSMKQERVKISELLSLLLSQVQ